MSVKEQSVVNIKSFSVCVIRIMINCVVNQAVRRKCCLHKDLLPILIICMLYELLLIIL